MGMEGSGEGGGGGGGRGGRGGGGGGVGVAAWTRLTAAPKRLEDWNRAFAGGTGLQYR